MKAKEWIINWFVENGNIEREVVENSMENNYIEAGLIDSFGFIQLVSDVEEGFGISFGDDDFANENIFVIGGLIQIIEDRVRNE